MRFFCQRGEIIGPRGGTVGVPDQRPGTRVTRPDSSLPKPGTGTVEPTLSARFPFFPRFQVYDREVHTGRGSVRVTHPSRGTKRGPLSSRHIVAGEGRR